MSGLKTEIRRKGRGLHLTLSHQQMLWETSGDRVWTAIVEEGHGEDSDRWLTCELDLGNWRLPTPPTTECSFHVTSLS